MSEHDEPTAGVSSIPTLPPGDVSATELMKTVFPLVVQAAAESASAATTAAEQGRSLEQTLSEMTGALNRNSRSIDEFVAEKKRENDLAEEKNRLLKTEKDNQLIGKKQLHETLRAGLTSPVMLQLIQLIVVIGAALGLWTQMPTKDTPSATLSEPIERSTSPTAGDGP